MASVLIRGMRGRDTEARKRPREDRGREGGEPPGVEETEDCPLEHLEGTWLCRPLASRFVVIVQSQSRVRLSATRGTAARQASLSLTVSQSSPKPMSIESLIPSSHLILCCPLFFLPSILLSIRVFSIELADRLRWPKYWSFSISPSNDYSGLISFMMDSLDFAVQETFKSLSEHHSSKASLLQHSAFFLYGPSDFKFPVPKTMKEHISFVLSHRVGGNLFRQP